MTEKEFDVLIIGAGPAGITCALMLAHTGLKIAVIDKATFPRDKICGDALTGKTMNTIKLLPDNILHKFINDFENKLPSRGIRFVAPNFKSLDLTFSPQFYKQYKHLELYEPNPPLHYISKRIDFDNFLFQELKNYSNISVFENCKIENIYDDKNKIIAESSDISFNAKIIVGADGANSIVRKLINGKTNLKHETRNNNIHLGLRAYYRNVKNFSADNFVEMYYFRNLLPGYFWLFPLPDNTANVGIGMLSSDIRKKKINLKSTMLSIIESNPLISSRFSDATLIDDIKAYSLPLCTKKMPVSGNKFLLTGDAASLIDPFTGEGIGNAMLSGRIAAEQIIECFSKNDFSADMLKNYDKKLYDKIWNEIYFSKIMQKLSSHAWLLNLIISKANKYKILHEIITKWCFSDVPAK